MYFLKSQYNITLKLKRYGIKGEGILISEDDIIWYVRNGKYFEARRAISFLLSQPILDKNNQWNMIDRIIKYIDEHYKDKIKLEDISIYVGRSKEYICRIFKSCMYMSFKCYLNFVKIEKAEEMLLETNMSVMMIAREIGIEDVAYFSKLFKKFNGCSPGKFRIQYFDSANKYISNNRIVENKRVNRR